MKSLYLGVIALFLFTACTKENLTPNAAPLKAILSHHNVATAAAASHEVQVGTDQEQAYVIANCLTDPFLLLNLTNQYRITQVYSGAHYTLVIDLNQAGTGYNDGGETFTATGKTRLQYLYDYAVGCEQEIVGGLQTFTLTSTTGATIKVSYHTRIRVADGGTTFKLILDSYKASCN